MIVDIACSSIVVTIAEMLKLLSFVPRHAYRQVLTFLLSPRQAVNTVTLNPKL